MNRIKQINHKVSTHIETKQPNKLCSLRHFLSIIKLKHAAKITILKTLKTDKVSETREHPSGK